jgi:hypothetical protein
MLGIVLDCRVFQDVLSQKIPKVFFQCLSSLPLPLHIPPLSRLLSLPLSLFSLHFYCLLRSAPNTTFLSAHTFHPCPLSLLFLPLPHPIPTDSTFFLFPLTESTFFVFLLTLPSGGPSAQRTRSDGGLGHHTVVPVPLHQYSPLRGAYLSSLLLLCSQIHLLVLFYTLCFPEVDDYVLPDKYRACCGCGTPFSSKERRYTHSHTHTHTLSLSIYLCSLPSFNTLRSYSESRWPSSRSTKSMLLSLLLPAGLLSPSKADRQRERLRDGISARARDAEADLVLAAAARRGLRPHVARLVPHVPHRPSARDPPPGPAASTCYMLIHSLYIFFFRFEELDD